jgi:glycosyltransferase involved in cell wall biosynthesis
MKPSLSIIIPCYNSENTMEETLVSVVEQDFQNWEAIMVNDGSPDNLERIALQWVLKDARFKYFKKENGGLGTARNFGIAKAEGSYILPLDSDNKIGKHFATKAISILDKNDSLDVVHGDALYFGEQKGRWKVPPFQLDKMLIKNYIDACAIYRKSSVESVGCYDTEMPYQGNEDWDLWLALGSNKANFHYLNEITFDYRVEGTSMIRSFSTEMFDANKAYIVKKYHHLYFTEYARKVTILNGYNDKPLNAVLHYLKRWIKKILKLKK